MGCFAALPAARGQQGQAIDRSYREAFEKWKAELTEDRKADWLTLAGLFWLKPGENSFGSAAANAIVLPSGAAPALAGTFVLQGREVSVNFKEGTHGLVEGKSIVSAKLDPDTSGHPTMVELGSLRMLVIQRGERIGIRVKDLNNPAVKAYRGPEFYPASGLYRVAAEWVPSDGKRTVQVPNILGDVTATVVPGEARFTLNGREMRLTALSGDAAHGFFIVFSDPTRKTETYPAGRFLKTQAVQDGKVVLDFNYAYNPPCALTPFATCPLPPSENQLLVAIRAGEKYDHNPAHH